WSTVFFQIFLIFYLIFYIIRKLRKEFKRYQALAERIINNPENLNDFSDMDFIVLNNLHKLATELNLKNKELKQQSKFAAIGQTTAMLAHDVRKPFNQLRLLLGSIDGYKNDSALLDRAVKSIDKSIKDVDKMLEDIMDFSRDVALETSATSLPAVINYSIRQACQAHQQKDVSFKYNLKHAQKPLLDEERISRVFINIVGNGIEAITVIGKKEEGTVFISSNDVMVNDNNYVEIRISNNGPAFNEEDIPRLFGTFFTKGKPKGTGLGLASAHKIVNLHGGKIEAANLPDNAGVEFIIKLPCSNQPETMQGLNELPNHIRETYIEELKADETEIDRLITGFKKQKFKILLLEDETLYRAGVMNIIKSNERLSKIITLYDAHTVDEALKLTEHEQITHAIVDIDLGDVKTGYAFLAELQKADSPIRSMVHSNRIIDESKNRARELGAVAYTAKPLNIEHLVYFLSGIKSSGADGVLSPTDLGEQLEHLLP
ncbi:MAG: response regulator, partial [Oligoflexia bacterium]|nr:response regulator [Oligoflexia bacterium]